MIFLRPWALLLLFVPLILTRILRHFQQSDNPWTKYIDKTLLPFLSVATEKTTKKTSIRFLFFVLWTLLSLALSGPAVDKLPVSGISDAPATVLIADLNTLNNEKTTQLQIKLYELITKLKGSQIGLILYDSEGYVASPLTQDTDVLTALVPSLNASVMPDSGNRLIKGVSKAVELLQNAERANGRIVLLTAGTPDMTDVLPLLKQTPYTFGTLGLSIGTVGTPILTKNGQFLRDSAAQLILAKNEPEKLKSLGVFLSVQPDNSELDQLLKETHPAETLSNLPFPTKTDPFVQMDVWRDLGVWFLPVSLVLLALLFRRGVFFLFFVSLFCFSEQEALASWWQRPDQISFQTIQSGNQHYRNKDFEAAKTAYEADLSANAFYNKGNALAYLGQYQDAIEAYAEALKQNPDDEDARFNKEYLEKMLQQQNQQSDQQNQEESETPDNADSENNENAESDKQDAAHNPPEQNEQDSQNDSRENNTNPENQQPPADDQTSNTDRQNESEQNSDNRDTKATAESSSQNDEQSSTQNNQTQQTPNPSDETDQNEQNNANTMIEAEQNASDMFDQETQQIINRLQTDPSRVLRYRLYRQYQTQQRRMK